MVDHVEAVLVGDLAELVQALGQDRPLLVLEDGLVLEDADVANTLHRAGLLGDDDAGRAQELQVLARGAEVRDDGLDAVADDEAGEPLGNDPQACSLGLFLRLFLRGVPAGNLGAGEAGLGQVVEHDVDGVPFADLGNIVVTPRNRVHAPGNAIGVVDRGCGIVDVSHCSSPMSRGYRHRRVMPVALFYSILFDCPDKVGGLGDFSRGFVSAERAPERGRGRWELSWRLPRRSRKPERLMRRTRQSRWDAWRPTGITQMWLRPATRACRSLPTPWRPRPGAEPRSHRRWTAWAWCPRRPRR